MLIDGGIKLVLVNVTVTGNELCGVDAAAERAGVPTFVHERRFFFNRLNESRCHHHNVTPIDQGKSVNIRHQEGVGKAARLGENHV